MSSSCKVSLKTTMCTLECGYTYPYPNPYRYPYIYTASPAKWRRFLRVLHSANCQRACWRFKFLCWLRVRHVNVGQREWVWMGKGLSPGLLCVPIPAPGSQFLRSAWSSVNGIVRWGITGDLVRGAIGEQEGACGMQGNLSRSYLKLRIPREILGSKKV